MNTVNIDLSMMDEEGLQHFIGAMKRAMVDQENYPRLRRQAKEAHDIAVALLRARRA